MTLVLEKELFLYFCYRNQTEEEMNIFSSDYDDECAMQRSNSKNEEQVYFLV